MSGAWHQDVILLEKFSAEQLSRMGFEAASAQIEVWTAFQEAPAPAVTATVVKSETNAVLRGQMAVPDVVDHLLDFGQMQMPQGRAFTEPQDGDSARVFKQWREIGGKRYLVESASYAELLPLLESLPVKTAALKPKRSVSRYAANTLPPARTKRSKAARGFQTGKVGGKLLASASPQVVLDYIIVTSQGDYVFRGDQTYYLSGAVTPGGLVTFEGGSVLKYAANASLNPGSYYPAIWQAMPYRPVVFTAKDDNTVGETISGSTGNLGFGAYANPALHLSVYDPFTMTNFRIAYAQQAITSQYQGHTFAHGQFINCSNGISGTGSVYVRNVLFANVSTAFNQAAYVSINAENVTFDGNIYYQATPAVLATPSGSYPYSINLKNCILTRLNAFAQGNVTVTADHNGFWNNTGSPFGTSPMTCPLIPFQSIGAGDHYLASDSPFRDQGTTTINADLANALRTKTTSPPQQLAYVTVSQDTTLVPQITRDTNEPDLGYHYDPIDYFISGYYHAFENCMVTIRGGAVISYQDSPGLWLKDGAELDCEGTPSSPNRFVDYRTVQEQPVKLGYYSGASTGIPLSSSRPSNVGSPARLRFTEFSRMAPGSYSAYDLYTSDLTWKFNTLDVRDCVFRGGRISFAGGGGVVSLVNNLMERYSFNVWGDPQVRAYNNLLKESYVGFDCNGASVVVRDNAFDSVVLEDWSDPPLTHSHNAYINVKDPDGNPARLNPAQASDKVLSSFTYAPGPLGNYYQAATTLRNLGSRSATVAGLDAYTTQADQTPDSGTVDIGLHYFIGGPPTVINSFEQACRLVPLSFLLSAWDPDGDLLSYTILTPPAHGTLSSGVGPNRTYTSFNYEGQDSFTFKVNDGFFDSSPATVTVDVGSLPTADSQNDLSTCPATPLQITLTGSDGCDQPGTLTFIKVTDPNPSHGSLGTITSMDATRASVPFTPNPAFCGVASFTFKVNDGFRDSAPATVDIDVGKKPAALPRAVATCRDTALNFALAGSDPCNLALTFSIVSGPSHAQSFTVSPNGSVSYVPASGYIGQDSFQFKVSNGCRDSDAAIVTIAVQQPPLAQCRDVLVKKNTSASFNLVAIGGTPLTFAKVPDSGPNHAQSFSLSANGTVTYLPEADYESVNGPDGFDFTVSGCGLASSAEHVTINVVPPPALAATCGPDRILLRWLIPPWVEALVTDLQIKRKVLGGSYSVIATQPADARSYLDASVLPGVTYCYIVTMRRQDPCTSLYSGVESEEVCLSTCSEPPCEEPIISGWLFTDEGFVGPEGDLSGNFRAYSDTTTVPASPWNFPAFAQCITTSSTGGLLLRMNFENDDNCASQHGPPNNPNTQIATVEGLISLSCQRKLKVNWCGSGERHQPDFELMTLRVGEQLLADAHSPGDLGTGCLAGMGPVVPRDGTPSPPQEIVLSPGLHILKIRTDSRDKNFHFGAFYEFEFTFHEP